MILAAAPQPSWAGVITAMASLFTAVALIITATGVAMTNRRTSKRIDRNQKDTTSRLAVIHTLVNSTLTAALQAQLDASRRELVMMLEMADMQERAGVGVTDDRKAAIGALRRKVGELSTMMLDRENQTRAADIQMAADAARQAEAD